MECIVPVRRLGDSFYIFGTRKIYAKIMNGKLVIRVGGGFMVIDEFIKTYTDQEMNKVTALNNKGNYDINNYGGDSPKGKRGGSGSPHRANQGSPR